MTKTTVHFQGPMGSGKTVLSRLFREFLLSRNIPATMLPAHDRHDAPDDFTVETDDLLKSL